MKKTLVAALLLTLIWAPNAVANGTGCHSIKDWGLYAVLCGT